MTDTHFREPIDRRKALSGTGRRGWEVPPEVQQKVVDIIIEEARKLGFDKRDTAHYLAIAKRESQFNPDAANDKGTASGIAQVTDSTGAIYGVNDSNRFDARTSIRAGLSYFRDLKEATIREFGSASGKYEPLIYYRYHYGENSTRSLVTVPGENGKRARKVWRAKPFAELEQNPRYPDSKTVVDEAARIEAVLNGAHGLVIQLNDVLGKPMGGRKVIAIVKKPRAATPAPAKPTPAPVAPPAATPPAAPAAAAPATAPTVGAPAAGTEVATAAPGAPQSMPAAGDPPASASGAPHAGEPGTDPQAAPAPGTGPDAATSAVTPPAAPGAGEAQGAAGQPEAGAAAAPAAPQEPETEWELHAQEVTTDAEGRVPEIVTDGQQEVMILIPRIDVQAYNEAVSKQQMPEDGNEHVLQLRGADVAPAPPAPAATPAAAPQSAPPKPAAPAPRPAPAKSAAPPRPAAPQGVFAAAAADSKAKAAPRPSPSREISFSDIVAAVKKDLGWDAVYSTSFSYIKQFYTRPRLPPAPLTNPARTAPGPARTQVIGSSLPNKDVKKPKVESQVKTAEAPAVKPVKASGDAGWMPIAIKEQGKDVKENEARHQTNAGWKAQNAARKDAASARDAAEKALKAERRKKAPDSAAIARLEAEIASQKSAYAAADAAMLKIEADFNNPDIVRYLQTTTLGKDLARDDATAWCSSFTNWVMEQAGYKGTDNALAESWLKWGEEIDEPRYGAITIVTRAANPTKYHVGFYVGMGQMSVPDGVEPVKDKQGKDTGKVRKKSRKVKAVNLLSGNFSGTVKEFAYWAVDKDDCEARHLVSYRWPTDKEKNQ